jgi:hypothetical protein
MNTMIAALVLALIAVVLLGALAGVVVLLVHSSTRGIGSLLSGVALLMGMGAAFLVIFTVRITAVSDGRAESAAAVPEPSVVSVAPSRERVAATTGSDPSPGIPSADIPAKPEKTAPAEVKRPTDSHGATDDPRPPWVDAAAEQVGGVYRVSVAVGPYATRGECDEHLIEAVDGAVAQYVEEYLNPLAARRVRLPENVARDTVKETWEETRQYTVGPMKNLHARLEFDHKFKGEIDNAWRRFQVTERISGMAGVLAVVLIGLTILYGTLKFAGRKKTQA